MARTPTWYDHVDDALAALRDFPAPHVERPDVERLFRLSRRDAIRFLHRFGAHEKNDRLTIAAKSLASKLEQVRVSSGYVSELRRRERLRAGRVELQRQASARRFLLPVEADSAAQTAADFPAGVRLYRDTIVVEFPEGSHDELLGRLFEIARIARDDPDGFQIAVEGAPPSPRRGDV